MANHEQHAVTTDAVMERTLFRNLVGFGLIGGLFYFAIQAFNDVIDDVVESKYEWVAERFSLSITHIHKEWMIKGKPKALQLVYHVSQQERAAIIVQVNQRGWPLNISSSDRELNCLSLWMLFAHEEGHRESMLDITSHLEIKSNENGCEFFHRDREIDNFIFSYNLNSGKVDTIGLD